ncbi:MAG: ribokinase [Bacteroidales bacterium]|jgi:ribokinase
MYIVKRFTKAIYQFYFDWGTLMHKIFIVGSLNMDMVFRIHSIPKKGETVFGDEFFLNPGGKGANQAIACARQGAEVLIAGTVGNDIFGEELINGLRKDGVNVDNIYRHSTTPTGTALILITGDDNRIVVAPGANFKTISTQIDAILTDAQPGDIYLTQMEIPYSAVSYGLAVAKAKKMYTILNPAPAQALDEMLLHDVDLIIPNETETEKITSFSSKNPNFALEAIAFFLNKGIKEIILTLGQDGCIYGNKDTIKKVSAYPVKVVDTTAAGDTFVGSIAVALAGGSKVIDALSIASAAAAFTISRLGAQCSIPCSSEICDFINHNSHKRGEN